MIRKIVLCALVSFVSAIAAMAIDSYIPIAGSVGAFRTDVRILNPSATHDITIVAYFLPVGNQANVLSNGVTLTIPKMQMAVYDDAVAKIFSATGLGAILFANANDQYFVTARIYAQTATGTLGQGFVGPTFATPMFSGALMQLRATPAFRTNIGVINPQNSTVSVTWTLYDKNNAMVGQKTITMPPYGVIAPTPITSGFFVDAGNADLTDAWMTFTSTGPIDSYASIIDNQTTDPTYLPAIRLN